MKERGDRRNHVLIELEKLRIQRPIRIDAIKHVNGAIGCTLSHITAIEYAMNQHWEHVFICEDDITFLNPQLLIHQIEKFEKIGMEWDVLIIGGNNCPPFDIISDACCRIHSCQTTTGYIVKSHYYATLMNNFRDSARHLIKEPTLGRCYALDIYWKRLQEYDNWFMIIPPTVIQYPNYSNIENKKTDYSTLMLDMEKKWIRR